MEKNVLLILVDKRKDAAVNVQKTLTGWGCLIKTRLGLHEGALENCTERGLIFCDLAGEKPKLEELTRKLNLIKGVKAKLVSLSFDED
jgi:hypothetical protein